jgi:hypothetical protein
MQSALTILFVHASLCSFGWALVFHPISCLDAEKLHLQSKTKERQKWKKTASKITSLCMNQKLLERFPERRINATFVQLPLRPQLAKLDRFRQKRS